MFFANISYIIPVILPFFTKHEWFQETSIGRERQWFQETSIGGGPVRDRSRPVLATDRAEPGPVKRERDQPGSPTRHQEVGVFARTHRERFGGTQVVQHVCAKPCLLHQHQRDKNKIQG